VQPLAQRPCGPQAQEVPHWHGAVQAQAACAAQPQVQPAPGQLVHWQFDWVLVFMADLLE
jgi:hypothetical protein